MFKQRFLLEKFLDESNLEMRATRDGFGDAMMELAEENEDIVALNADLPGSLRLDKFEEKYPERMIQVGVAEQAMAGLGTGLALYGKIPFISTFAAFSPGLNWSNIRLAAMSKANIKVVSSHYGLNVGPDGASAQMLADIALMRVLPNFVVMSPADYYQTVQAVKFAANHNGPVYIRVTRDKFPVYLNPETEFDFTKAQVLKEGLNVTIVATGSVVYEAIKTAEMLEEEGIKVELINLHTIKPLDKATIIESIKKTGKLVTIEEHYNAGGMGSAVLESICSEIAVPTLMLGVNDKFGTSGEGKEVMKAYGLHRDDYANKIRAFIKQP